MLNRVQIFSDQLFFDDWRKKQSKTILIMDFASPNTHDRFSNTEGEKKICKGTYFVLHASISLNVHNSIIFCSIRMMSWMIDLGYFFFSFLFFYLLWGIFDNFFKNVQM